MVSSKSDHYKRMKSTAMYRKLQLLHSITNSYSMQRKTSVILNTLCIQVLKKKLQELNEAIAAAQNFIDNDPRPKVKVEAEEKGLKIKVMSQKRCEGLLVFILEAIEELGLDVLQARVSSQHTFSLEALAVAPKKKDNEENGNMDAQLVQQAVSQAIQNWNNQFTN